LIDILLEMFNINSFELIFFIKFQAIFFYLHHDLDNYQSVNQWKCIYAKSHRKQIRKRDFMHRVDVS